MEPLQGVLEALAKLVTALGPWWTVALLVALIVYGVWRDYRKERLEKSIADEKEAQIQRLAEDNRWMRLVLMEKVMGYSESEAARLVNEGRTTPLLAVKTKEQA